MRGDVPAGKRGFFVLEMATPPREGRYQLEFHLRFLEDGKVAQRVFLGRFHLWISEKNIDQPRRYRVDEENS
jgi:hypothetical protein